MVTSQKDQIQSLIADIEQVLGTEKPRTPWIKASETESQRQALARAQDYLMSLKQSFDAPGGWGPVDPATGQLVTAPNGASSASDQPTNTQAILSNTVSSVGSVDQGNIQSTPGADSPDNVLQALLTEMKFLKSSALEPLRKEMDSLRAERDSLNAEVKALAEQRNQASLAQATADTREGGVSSGAAYPEIDEQQLNDFLQALMVRLQERLSEQVTQTFGQLEAEHAAALSKLSAATEAELLQLQPGAQIEEMRQLQSRSDQLLVNIDSTLQGMFSTLQKNIDSYQISLNEGIENMHSLGRQGEVIVRSLVDHLTQQLGQTVPPEPAFFPPRPAAFAESPLPNFEPDPAEISADTGSSFVGSPTGFQTDSSTGAVASPATDTVTSLNEVLPEGYTSNGRTATPYSPAA